MKMEIQLFSEPIYIQVNIGSYHRKLEYFHSSAFRGGRCSEVLPLHGETLAESAGDKYGNMKNDKVSFV
jgi:hypothetical protein